MPSELFAGFDAALSRYTPPLRCVETGLVTAVAQGVARVTGLPGVAAMELVRFADDSTGVAFDLGEAEVGVVLLRSQGGLQSGTMVERTGRVLDTPVGTELLGRVLNALGEPLDDGGPITTGERWPVERPAPPIMARAPVSVSLARAPVSVSLATWTSPEKVDTNI